MEAKIAGPFDFLDPGKRKVDKAVRAVEEGDTVASAASTAAKKKSGPIARVLERSGEHMARGAKKEILQTAPQVTDAVMDVLSRRAPEIARETVDKGVIKQVPKGAEKAVQGLEKSLAKRIGKLAPRAGASTGIGALAGAITSDDGPAKGSFRGGIGGLTGGALGGALGRRFGVNPQAAMMGGAALGGGYAGLLGEEQPVHKYAGVTLDYFDDKGALLKEVFPTEESLPECIKTASIKPPEQVPDEAYALIALEAGRPLKKFACLDQGTTAMSVIYFMENHDKLPESAVKTAAQNLFNACVHHKLVPPTELTKMAKIFGARPDGSALDPALPYEVRKGAYEDYLQEKAKEQPSSIPLAMGVGGGLGGGLGALMGGRGGRLVGAGIGALGGSAVGGLAALADRGDINQAKHILKNEDTERAMIKHVMQARHAEQMERRQGQFIDHLRHQQLLNALQKQGSVEQSATAAANAADSATQTLQSSFGGGGNSGGGLLSGVKSFFGSGGDAEKAGSVDITGQSPKPKFAAKPVYDEDYAVITDDGRRMYPIDTWDNIKLACDYWALESRRMEPEMRRQFAVKLAAKAFEQGYPIDDETLLDAGSPGYADFGHVKAAMDMRKVAFPGSENKVHREFLDELLEKTAELQPEVFAECVRRFDVMNGLDGGWDQVVPSPWESTFGLQKTAMVVWEQGVDRVTDAELNNLARNYGGDLSEKFSDDFVKGFEKDPVGVFKSLPLPQKQIMARLAADMAAQGGSFISSYNEKSTKKSAA